LAAAGRTWPPNFPCNSSKSEGQDPLIVGIAFVPGGRHALEIGHFLAPHMDSLLRPSPAVGVIDGIYKLSLIGEYQAAGGIDRSLYLAFIAPEIEDTPFFPEIPIVQIGLAVIGICADIRLGMG